MRGAAAGRAGARRAGRRTAAPRASTAPPARPAAPAGGSGVLFTVEPAEKVPSADDYLKEVSAFLRKEKAEITAPEKPTRVRAEPVQLDRFAMDAALGADKVRLEYAVLRQTDGGV